MENENKRVVTFFCLFQVAVSLSSFAQGLLAAVQPVLDAQASYFNTSLSLGISSAAESVAAVAGVQDHSLGRKMTVDTHIPMGSATKFYTAVAVMQLHEEGTIDIDAPVYTIVDPWLLRANGTTLKGLWGSDKINTITARQLMAMRAGVADYIDAEVQAYSTDPATWDDDITPFDYVHKFAPKNFLFPPGQGGAYSSIGYELLGFVLAAATNSSSWSDFDQASILNRLPPNVRKQLRGFQFAGLGPCSKDNNTAHQYMVDIKPNGYWYEVRFNDLYPGSCLNGWTFGSLNAVPEDVAKVMYAVLGASRTNPLLSQESITQMKDYQPFTTGWSTGLDYGLGIMKVTLAGVSKESQKPFVEMEGHAGLDYGSMAPLHYYNAATDLSVCMAINSDYGLNCDLNPVVQNQYLQEAACYVWQAIVNYTTQGDVQVDCKKKISSPAPYTRPRSSLSEALTSTNRLNKIGNTPSPTEFHCAGQGSGVCTNNSSSLSSDECFSWKALHSTLGGSGWKQCQTAWDDPCSCPLVTCADSHITRIDLSTNNLHGEIPDGLLSKLGSLTFLNMSFNLLYGSVPSDFGQLQHLSSVDLRGNLLSSKLPSLPFKQYSNGCFFQGNDFDCPLPLFMPKQCVVDPCDSINNYVSTACLTSIGKIEQNSTFKVLAAAVQLTAQQLSQEAGKKDCGEIYQTHKCNMTLDWTQHEDVLQRYRTTVAGIDPTAQVCFLDSSRDEQIQNIGTCFIETNFISLVPFPSTCSAKDRAGLFKYYDRPSQCILQSIGYNCSTSFSNSACKAPRDIL